MGTCERLFSTVLQGFYQSHQATAAACQVNNVHLLRGMIGRPGAGLCQMNGQPTAQNTRETGADGDLPGIRNWDNKAHVAELARLWNVDEMQIPHWSPPTHAMQIWRYAEQGSIKLLWISATNPAVSMPDLARVRRILEREELFVVVQDVFMTETARFADVVLPAATWGEKTGTFTNADRTVHLSEKAVEPPGEARADLEIFLDYARRMDFRDRDGEPLIAWDDAEGAFEAWKACSKGRPCDYSGMTYDLLRGSSGIQWPCTAERPEGTERLYTDGVFNTEPSYCGDVRAGPEDRGSAQRGRVPRQGGPRSRVPAQRRLLRPRRAADRRVPAAAHHRPHRLPLPHAHQDRLALPSCRQRRPTFGWSSTPATPPMPASRRATWCGSSRLAARSRRRRASTASGRAWSSCRSTTATGTPATGRRRTVRPAARPTS